MMNLKYSFIRNIESESLFENFLISAISSILVIRFYLSLSGYPKIGTSDFHIAHLFFGGLFMVAALIIFFNYLNKQGYQLASVLGGVGFGTFIDEIGKFITSDNNYFFQPAFALIYLIFALLYLVYKFINRKPTFSQQEYLINSIEVLKEAIINDLDKQGKKNALKLLNRVSEDNPLKKIARHLFEEIEVVQISEAGTFSKIKSYLRNRYFQLVQTKWFSKIIILLFILQALIAPIFILSSLGILIDFLFNGKVSDQSFLDIWGTLSTTASGVVALWGVIKLRRSRLYSLQLFKRSVLITIFLTQIVSFYFDPVLGFSWLCFNLLLILALNFRSTPRVKNPWVL